jgi:hypothetical protein
MNSEELNNQMRKFLREVGVTSQQEIEKAVASADRKSGHIRLTMRLTSPDIPLDHVVERTIDLP